MKVVHINTSQSGGAALCAIRIHNALKRQGVESKMIFAQGKKSEDFDVLSLEEYPWSKNWLFRKLQAIACKLHLWPRYEHLIHELNISRNNAGSYSFFTLPLSQYKTLVNHPWIKEADIIHLHWICDFMDYPSFFCTINKPIVWTLHDENPGIGGFLYQGDFKEDYSSLDKECYAIKKKTLERTNNINLVAISGVMQKFIDNNSLLKRFPTTLIHNGIVDDSFLPKDKTKSRRDLGLPESGRKIFLFSSYYLWNERKGLLQLISALEQIDFNEKPILVCIGHYDREPQSEKIDFVYPGLIKDNEDLLSTYYSAADFFIMSSFQESFGQTPLEAMACGTPVVGFPCGVNPELINERNGVVCDDYTIESLVSGIRRAIDNQYDPEEIRRHVILQYSYDLISKKYLELYKKVQKES